MSAVWAERTSNPRSIFNSEPPANYSGAREAFTDELCRHPSVLGRLAAIATLWDEEDGRYRHPLAAHYGTEDTDRVLRRLHQEIFIAWLSLTLRQQQADVSIYMGGLGIKPEWFDFRKMGLSCIPQSATLPEKDLFLADLELVQSLQRY